MPASYELVFDVLGYEAEIDGQTQRCEIEGRGKVFSEADLHPAALERGLETGALVDVSDKPAAADDAPAAKPKRSRGSKAAADDAPAADPPAE